MLEILGKLAWDDLVFDALGSHEFVSAFGLGAEDDCFGLEGLEVGKKHVIKEYMICGAIFGRN